MIDMSSPLLIGARGCDFVSFPLLMLRCYWFPYINAAIWLVSL